MVEVGDKDTSNSHFLGPADDVNIFFCQAFLLMIITA